MKHVVEPSPSRRDDVAGRAPRKAALTARYLRATVPAGCLRRFGRIHGRDRALALAGQCFTAVVPLLIVMSTVAASDQAFANRLIRRFHLTGSAAQAVDQLFSRPPGATGAITLLGITVLAFSTLSFTRGLQRTWEAAWDLPPAGVRGTLHAVSGVGLLLAQVLALTLLTNAVRGWPGGGVLALVLHVLLASVLWQLLQYLLLARRVQWLDLVPGALVAGIAQVTLSIYSAVWMPRLIRVDAERYGVIGVTFALLTWLVVISLVMVGVAVVSAEVGLRRRADPRPGSFKDMSARDTATRSG